MWGRGGKKPMLSGHGDGRCRDDVSTLVRPGGTGHGRFVCSLVDMSGWGGGRGRCGIKLLNTQGVPLIQAW
jgi:hypothetical protein